MRYSLLFLLSCVTQQVLAQRVPSPSASRLVLGDSSVPSIMAHAGVHLDRAAAARILRSVDKSRSRDKLDELADSLTARALDPRASTRGSDQAAAAERAVGELAYAGFAASPDQPGTPYSGAAGRLDHIQQTTASRGIRMPRAQGATRASRTVTSAAPVEGVGLISGLHRVRCGLSIDRG